MRLEILLLCDGVFFNLVAGIYSLAQFDADPNKSRSSSFAYVFLSDIGFGLIELKRTGGSTRSTESHSNLLTCLILNHLSSWMCLVTGYVKSDDRVLFSFFFILAPSLTKAVRLQRLLLYLLTCGLFWKRVTDGPHDRSSGNVYTCDFICDICDQTRAQTVIITT